MLSLPVTENRERLFGVSGGPRTVPSLTQQLFPITTDVSDKPGSAGISQGSAGISSHLFKHHMCQSLAHPTITEIQYLSAVSVVSFSAPIEGALHSS